MTKGDSVWIVSKYHDRFDPATVSQVTSQKVRVKYDNGQHEWFEDYSGQVQRSVSDAKKAVIAIIEARIDTWEYRIENIYKQADPLKESIAKAKEKIKEVEALTGEPV